MERDVPGNVIAVVSVTPSYRPHLSAGAAVTVAIVSKVALGLDDVLALMVLAALLGVGLLGAKVLAATRSERREMAGSIEEIVDAVTGSLNGGYCELYDATIVLRGVERTVAVRLPLSDAQEFVQRYYARVPRDAGPQPRVSWLPAAAVRGRLLVRYFLWLLVAAQAISLVTVWWINQGIGPWHAAMAAATALSVALGLAVWPFLPGGRRAPQQGQLPTWMRHHMHLRGILAEVGYSDGSRSYVGPHREPWLIRAGLQDLWGGG